MSVFEFVLILAGIGVSGLGYVLAYKDLRRQVKRLQKELEEKENGNEK